VSGVEAEAHQHFRSERRAQRPNDFRSSAERDCDRILYSSAFRRLASVTQVVSVAQTQLFHNRLTHTLKVAQVGRRLAQRLQTEHLFLANGLGGIDPDVVEAAAMAHDIGHPPFGHIAEDELQQQLKDGPLTDSFEGNAQSFRIVTKLAFRSLDADEPALNLSRATLRALLKYPWIAGEQPAGKPAGKWGAYRSEANDFAFATTDAPAGSLGVEAELMDWADDIAYAVHDIEDFYRAGLIPLDRLKYSVESNRFIARASAQLASMGYDADVSADAFDKLQSSFLPIEPYRGTRDDRAGLHDFASSLISRYVNAANLLPHGLQIHQRPRHEVAMLKQLTWYYVIDNPALASVQRGQRKVIADLYRHLNRWTTEATRRSSEMARLPAHLRELLLAARTDNDALAAASGDDDILRTRAVIDYITSLTEDQAFKLHQKLCGDSSASLDRWLSV
jgi:dGTPase